HPVLKILGGAKSLPDSVQIDIDQSEDEAKAHFAELERWCKEASEIDRIPETARDERSRFVNGKIAQTEWKLRRDNLSISRLQLLKSIYTRCLPQDRFHALLWLLVAFVGTIAIKGVFEFAQESLVGNVTNLTVRNLRKDLYRSAIRQDVGRFGDTGTHDL